MDEMEGVPSFARQAVLEVTAYEQAWRQSLDGLVRKLEGREMQIDSLVKEVAAERGVSRVIVHTALARLLRRHRIVDARSGYVKLAK